MSVEEFVDAPVISRVLYTGSKPTLTNVSNSCIALQFFDRNEVLVNPKSGITFDAIVHFTPDSFVFYDDIVVTRATDINYNVPKVESYLQNKILSNTITTLPLPVSDIRTVSGGNHVLNVDSTGIITKTISQNTTNLDHIQIYTAVDSNNNIACIVYRDKQGLSYSLDAGRTVIPISNEGLLYPLEITSVAIQVYSAPLLDIKSPRIYVGTLREGIKAFSPGDSAYTWADGMDSYVKLESGGLPSTTTDVLGNTIHNVRYIFKHSVATDRTLAPELDQNTGVFHSHTGGDFAPVYIIGLLNSPVDAGNPLICYVRSNIQDYVTKIYSKITRYVSCNLRESVNLYIKDTVYDIYRKVTDLQYAVNERGWRILQETINSTTTRNPYSQYVNTSYTNIGLSLDIDLPSIIVDITKTITIGTNFAAISTTNGLISIIDNNSTASILKISTSASIGADLRHLSIEILPACAISPKNITGFTAYWTSDTTQFQLFLTTSNKVLRFYGNEWSDFIVSNAWDSDNQTINLQLTKYLYNFYDPTLDSPSIAHALPLDVKTHLIGLREFSLFSIGNNEHLGIMGSDLGYVTTHFIKKIDDFISPMSIFRDFRLDLYSSWSTDLVYIPEARKIISCTLGKTPPLVYEAPVSPTDPPIRYYLYDPTLDSYSTSIEGIKSKIFYRNYGSTGETKYYFYNKYNTQYFDILNNHHFDQQPTIDIRDVEYLHVEPSPSQSDISGVHYAADAESTTTYNFLLITDTNDPHIMNYDSVLANYLVTNPNKYRHLKILLRATQKLSAIWDEITTETDTIFTYFLLK